MVDKRGEVDTCGEVDKRGGYTWWINVVDTRCG